MAYDSDFGETALEQCGEGNVKSVSTKGYFKKNVVCFTDKIEQE
jgi:hypothetical protein